jgi:hypothetical protein
MGRLKLDQFGVHAGCGKENGSMLGDSDDSFVLDAPFA